MIINLQTTSKSYPTTPPVISLNGLILTVGDIDIDLSQIPDGGQGEVLESSPLVGIATRDEVTVKYPYSIDVYSPLQSTNTNDYIIELLDGETMVCPLKKHGEV